LSPTIAIAQLIRALSWLALPVGLICVIDDWLLRPKRQMAMAPKPVADSPLLSRAYRVLPILIAAAVLRLFVAEQLDFSTVLVIISAVSGLIWAADAQLLGRQRRTAARAAGKDPAAIPEPGTVDYARSFFPVAIAVLLLRAFVFEPFRIPSDSMMPTLRDGDFIVVEKFAYGLRLPITDTKILDTGEPKRGDVVVFHPPIAPSQAWIKRVVGLPGDHVTVNHDRLIINGRPVPFKITGTYNDGCYVNMQLARSSWRVTPTKRCYVLYRSRSPRIRCRGAREAMRADMSAVSSRRQGRSCSSSVRCSTWSCPRGNT
jgi:signal peptidase I